MVAIENERVLVSGSIRFLPARVKTQVGRTGKLREAPRERRTGIIMSALRRAKITALGRYVPPKVVTNYDLAKRVDTNHDWVVARTGIVERHWVEPGTPTSELAAQAVGDLLKNRGIEADEIELIIVATVTPDMFFPATAWVVQKKVRATRAWGFDVSAACSGFLYALTVGAQFIRTGAHTKVVVIGADVMSSITNPDDRSTCVLFGDADRKSTRLNS